MRVSDAEVPALADPRVTLRDLLETAGALGGVADRSLEPTLAAYAAARGVRLEVRFPQPRARQVVWGRTPLFRDPSLESETVSEVGFGETIDAYDARAGFVRVAARWDGYLGWVPAAALGALPEATHRFARLSGHLRPRIEVAARRLLSLSYGAPVHVLGEAEGWLQVALADGAGYVPTGSLEPAAFVPQPTPEAVVRFAQPVAVLQGVLAQLSRPQEVGA